MQKEEFKEWFSQQEGSLIDICNGICQIINNEPDEPEKIDLFIIACENFGAHFNRKDIFQDSSMSNDGLKKLEMDNADAIEAIITSSIKVAISNQYSNRDFYGYLWRSISSAYHDESLAFALYKILVDKRIPYHKISKGLSMEDNEYSEITQNCLHDIKKCRFILDVGFDQKTKEASNLLEVILSHELKEEQIVILSQVLTYCKLFKFEEIFQALSKEQDDTPNSSECTST